MASYDQVAERINMRLNRREYDLGEVRQLMSAASDVAMEECLSDPVVAAAPELLESLVDMVDMFERHIDGRPGPDDAAQRWDRARAAIAKATKGA